MWRAAIFTGLFLFAADPSRADDARGRVLFLEMQCDGCHAVPGAGIARTAESTGEGRVHAPSLPGAPRTAAWVKRFLQREEVGASGKRHVRKFRRDDADLEVLATWLAALPST